MCKTNKLTNDICQQKQFWYEKGLPQSVFNLSSKISDRVKLIKITKIIDLLITLFNNDRQIDEGIYITFYHYDHLPHVQFLLPLLINEINQLDDEMSQLYDFDDIEKHIKILYKEDIILEYYYEDDEGFKIDEIKTTLTRDQFKDFLIRLFFYYPQVEIEDDACFSYLNDNRLPSNKVLNDRKTFLQTHHISYKINHL